MGYKKLEKTAYEKLNQKQKKFVDAYMGEALGSLADAAELAGYSGSRTALSVAGKRNIENPEVFAAIKEIEAASPLVATRDERLTFLTAIMRDKLQKVKDRLKAADQLSKACGDYIQKMELSGPDGQPIQTLNQNVTNIKMDSLSDEELMLMAKVFNVNVNINSKKEDE